MIPSAVIFLETMPLTPNGKIDRKSLPQVADPGPLVVPTETTPTGPTQLELAKIWRDVLRVPSVAADANFFKLGGNSLDLVRVAARTRQWFGRELPLHGFLEHPTIADLARWIEAGSAPAVRPMILRSDNAVAPLSFGQQRLWFLDRFEPGLVVYNVASVQELNGPLDVDKLQAALAAVVGRHDTLRTIFPEVEGAPTQVTLAPDQAPVELLRIDLSSLPAEQRLNQARFHIAANTRRSFDLGKEPLLHAWLIRLGPDRHILSLCLHHIICDDWSMRLMYAEMSRFYAGRAAPPPPTLQYRDYASWQRRWLEAGEMQRQIEYWVKQLGDAPPLLALPTDRPRPRRQTFNGTRLPVTLGPDLARSIAGLARQHQTTSFITLLAAFQLLMSQWTGQQDIVVGTPVANRNRPETQGLIGFFLNTLAFRTRLGRDANFIQLLQHVRNGALEAFANQDVPFERLIEELHVPRNLSHSPLIQVMFILLDEGLPTLELPGITAQALAGESTTAKFDVTLLLYESGDQMQGWLEYNTDLFDAATISALIDRWLNLVRAIVTDPRASLESRGVFPSPLYSEESARERAQSINDQPPKEMLRAPTFSPAYGDEGKKEAINPPSDSRTQHDLLAIWQEVLGLQTVGVDESFFDLGGHSLLAVRLLYRIRRHFGRALPLACLFEGPTIRQLTARLDQQADQASQSEDIVVPLRRGNARLPLFCLPGAGGYAITYHALTRFLPREQPVYGLQVQGLPPQIKNHGSVEQMAAGLLDALLATQGRGPYRLAGYSFGGVVAFEMARQLEARDQRVDLLAIFDSSAPGNKHKRPRYQRLWAHGRRLLTMPPLLGRERARLLLNILFRRVKSTFSWSQSLEPPPDDSELLQQVQFLREVAKAAFLAYDPQPLAGSLTLFRATVKSNWHEFLANRPANGWLHLARGGVAVHDIPADHDHIIMEPDVALLAHKLDQCLR